MYKEGDLLRKGSLVVVLLSIKELLSEDFLYTVSSLGGKIFYTKVLDGWVKISKGDLTFEERELLKKCIG